MLLFFGAGGVREERRGEERRGEERREGYGAEELHPRLIGVFYLFLFATVTAFGIKLFILARRRSVEKALVVGTVASVYVFTCVSA